MYNNRHTFSSDELENVFLVTYPAIFFAKNGVGYFPVITGPLTHSAGGPD